MGDVQIFLDALEAKRPEHEKRFHYYEGKHPLVFANDKLNEVFKRQVVFVQNWTEVISNATADRLRILAVDDNESVDLDYITNIAADVHLSCAICGEGYVVAWPDADGATRAYFNDPRIAHVFYDEMRPDVPTWGGKRWTDATGAHILLYYPDRIEHYVAKKDSYREADYIPDGDMSGSNPSGMLPIFHFRRDASRMTGELTLGVTNIQDAVNKLFTDMMVASEYSAFAQRWAIGNFDTSQPMPVGPGTLATFPGSVEGEQSVAVGTFATTSPTQFLEPIERLAGAMATISRTPRHYFSGTGGDPSGEALAAMESPLVAKVLTIQTRLTTTWNALLAFGWGGGTIIWYDPHTVQPMMQASIRKANVEAGIPIMTVLRDEGWTKDQLEKMVEDMNVTMTANSIPNSAALPPALQATVAPLARKAQKANIEDRATPSIAKALTDISESIPTDAVAGVLTKFNGKSIRE
jgi:hypothetical protein